MKGSSFSSCTGSAAPLSTKSLGRLSDERNSDEAIKRPLVKAKQRFRTTRTIGDQRSPRVKDWQSTLREVAIRKEKRSKIRVRSEDVISHGSKNNKYLHACLQCSIQILDVDDVPGKKK